MTLVGAAGTAGCLASCAALGEVGLGWLVHACLGDVDDVQDAVDFTVAGQVEAMSSGLAVALSGGHGHGCGAAPPGELGFGLSNRVGSPISVSSVMAVTTPTPTISVRVQPSSLRSAGTSASTSLMPMVMASTADSVDCSHRIRAESARDRAPVSRVRIVFSAAMTRLVAGSWSRISTGRAHRTGSASVSSRTRCRTRDSRCDLRTRSVSHAGDGVSTCLRAGGSAGSARVSAAIAWASVMSVLARCRRRRRSLVREA